PDTGFSIEPYLRAIRWELDSLGLRVSIEAKKKQRPYQIESAFIKADTIQNLIYLEVPQEVTGTMHRNARLKVKLEIDIQPPPYAKYKMESLLLPIPFLVKLYSVSCLFSGKLHALLCRQWKSRIKGRDFYDFLWFIGKKIPCNLKHLKARMVQTGHFEQNKNLNRDLLIKLLHQKIDNTDLQLAKHDIEPFVNDINALDLWTPGFFHKTIDKIVAEAQPTQ
ncbi:MAG: nucleotidyl transferase AbiEii/AbiGii toxin family protein, partial [Chitinispirillia bacterium]